MFHCWEFASYQRHLGKFFQTILSNNIIFTCIKLSKLFFVNPIGATKSNFISQFYIFAVNISCFFFIQRFLLFNNVIHLNHFSKIILLKNIKACHLFYVSMLMQWVIALEIFKILLIVLPLARKDLMRQRI